MFLVAAVFATFVALLTLVLLFMYWYMSLQELKGVNRKSVFITGCDTGFGNLLAKSLDRKGVRVFAGCLTEEGAAKLRSETSSRLLTVIVNITQADTIQRAYEFVKAHLNEEGLWGVVNNAGVMPTFAPVEWTTMEEFEQVFNVNFFGTIAVTKAFLPLLRQSSGRLVNVCSVTSNCGYPGISSYVTSKSALKMFSVCLRRELLHSGVTVHTIEPGGFQTNITDHHRMAGMVKKAYKRSSPELQAVYGGHVCDYLLSGIKTARDYCSSKPQYVADAMTHALLSRMPKLRYLVGPDAHVFFRLLGYLPDRVVDYILGWPALHGTICSELEQE